ncbi:MAG TPA: DUF3365 domain-containing protein, partial [Anaeromyxobacteraceae bacterium]|nr:DUF3365 domain-containing protein [Anaeromyxobacteraceae bacterium]
QRLSRQLMEELANPPAAVAVCAEEAPAIAAEVAAASGVAVGRTSDRLRSPANAPRPWVRPFLAEAAGRPAAEARPVLVDLGDRIGLLRPVGVGAPCLKCHAEPERLSPGVRDALTGRYQADAATGYAEGDFRGFFWAEAAK